MFLLTTSISFTVLLLGGTGIVMLNEDCNILSLDLEHLLNKMSK